MKRDMQNEIFKLNSDIHKTQKDIDELLKKLRDIDLEISEKVRMNQDKMIESAKIEMAVNNLHRMATESKNKKQKEALKQNSMEQQPKISLIEDLTHKLEEIQDKMAELKFYYKTFKGHR